MYIDSHCHLNFNELSEDLENVLIRAKKSGVSSILCIATKKDNFQSVIDIANKYNNIWCTIGVHPHSVESDDIKYEDIIEYYTNPKVVGIGETGLDYHYNYSPKDKQIASFKMHCDISKETNLPLIIHNRLGEKDILSILTHQKKINPKLTGVIHCFSSTYEFASKCIELGFYISFSGILTFKNAELIRETAKKIPLDRLLIETDAPYLAPVPYRGKVNEPAYVVETAKKLSEVCNISLDDIAKITTNNFFNLFNKIPHV